MFKRPCVEVNETAQEAVWQLDHPVHLVYYSTIYMVGSRERLNNQTKLNCKDSSILVPIKL